MAGDLFQDLPPPTAPKSQQFEPSINRSTQESSAKLPPPIPAPALKSALKRPKEPIPNPVIKSALKRPNPTPDLKHEAAAPEKRLRFKTTTDASEKQVIDAMQKIASHIQNPSKFKKASKLAIQLIEAGSVKQETSIHFFALLEGAMSSLTTCNDTSLRADYHALFSAAQDAADFLSKKQQNLLSTWTTRTVLANDLFTDDSFVFSKATGRMKEAISSLPVATREDDIEEAAVSLKDEMKNVISDEIINKEEESPDPFGLDALIMPSALNKNEKSKLKKDDEEEEKRRFLNSQREALITCLEIAAKRYKTPWCQTSIDIIVKHSFDNISRFNTKQRGVVEKLWGSIREQQALRKQGKSVDVNGFEWLQQKYSTEKISIRRSVGGSGDRKCQQWLG